MLKLSPIPLTKNLKYDLLTKKVINQLKANSNCIDVGCHKGEILDLMVHAAPEGKHFGFEPIPELYNQLVEKYASNASCKIYSIAASNTKGQSEFNYVVSNPSYSGLKKRDYDRPSEVDEKIQVETDLLDNIIPKDLPIDLIKIDVEGAELLVLEGASELIKRDQPLVVFEYGIGASDHYDSKPEEMFNFFQERTMHISNLDDFLNHNNPLTIDAFKRQYLERENYYFIAHK